MPIRYTTEELVRAAQQYYAQQKQLPTVRSVPWGRVAVRRFGKWTTFLLAAGLPVAALERKNQYTHAYFIQEIQTYYHHHHTLPVSSRFVWSGAAIQRFGSWNALIRAAGYRPRKPGGAYYED